MSAAALVLGGLPTRRALAQSTPYPSTLGNPFTLGVASGDPLPDGVVLWTRLAPDPPNGGGMDGQGDVEVRWEVASDEDFGTISQSGAATATPELGHSVHVEVGGLEPGRFYWYRFKAGDEISPTGRTKTTPTPGIGVGAMAFAFASCQSWQAGLYPAYNDIANQDLDLVVHLGDYIYENGPTAGGPRVYKTAAPTDLAGYRNRHAEYKTDASLQKAHARHPWVVSWDDHEVQNDYAGYTSWYSSPSDFAKQRSSAYQAYYEHMPMRLSSAQLQEAVNSGWASMPLYRRITYGDLAQFSILDTRQYRTVQPCGDGLTTCNERFKNEATMTGTDQESWLLDGLDNSGSRWNVLANQVIMFEYDHTAGSGESYYMDGWDGYVAARNRVLGHLSERRTAGSPISNPVVITGDMHSSWVVDLKANFQADDSPVVATEFAGTSISPGLSRGWIDTYRGALGDNPHVKYLDTRQGGYVRCNLTPSNWRSDLRIADSVHDPQAAVRTVASFVVEDGRPGAVPLSTAPPSTAPPAGGGGRRRRRRRRRRR